MHTKTNPPQKGWEEHMPWGLAAHVPWTCMIVFLSISSVFMFSHICKVSQLLNSNHEIASSATANRHLVVLVTSEACCLAVCLSDMIMTESVLLIWSHDYFAWQKQGV